MNNINRKIKNFDANIEYNVYIGEEFVIVIDDKYDKVFVNNLKKETGFVEMITRLKSSSSSNKGKNILIHLQITPYSTEIEYDVYISNDKMCCNYHDIKFLERVPQFSLHSECYSKLPIIPKISKMCTNGCVTIVEIEPSIYEIDYKSSQIYIIYEKDNRVEHHDIIKKDVLKDGGTTYIETMYDSVKHNVYFPSRLNTDIKNVPEYDGIKLSNANLDNVSDEEKQSIIEKTVGSK